MRTYERKKQYDKAISIAKDLYEYALLSDDKQEILDYQLAITNLLTNCQVRISSTWSIRLNKLKDIMLDPYFDRKLKSRIRSGMRRFKNYESNRLNNDKVQYFYRSEEVLD